MSVVVTVFYAHSSGDDVKDIARGCSEIKELIRAKGERAGKDLRVSVVPGRDDFRVHNRGDWDVWAKSIVRREHAMTRKPFYSMIIIPSQNVGRATATIVGHAVKAGRPVFLFTEEGGEWGRLQRITQVYPYDVDDWQGGYRCESERQLPLPFKENDDAKDTNT